jgi:hypothetical protein
MNIVFSRTVIEARILHGGEGKHVPACDAGEEQKRDQDADRVSSILFVNKGLAQYKTNKAERSTDPGPPNPLPRKYTRLENEQAN